jgi:hypothetical protein
MQTAEFQLPTRVGKSCYNFRRYFVMSYIYCCVRNSRHSSAANESRGINGKIKQSKFCTRGVKRAKIALKRTLKEVMTIKHVEENVVKG